MYAVEFETTAINGTIRIPLEYRLLIGAHVRVIVLQEETESIRDTVSQKSQFLENVARHRFSLPKDYHFNREELHERG